MALTYAPLIASGSTSGRCIKIHATADPGTLLHQAVAGAAAWDEIYIWVSNTSNAPATLTIEFGGNTDPDDMIVRQYEIPANSPPMPIVTGQRLNGGLSVRAFASVADVLVASLNINRIQ